MNEIRNSRPCLIRGCESPGVVTDDAGRIKHLVDSFEVEESVERWLCNEHAVEYLFPLIDAELGNVTDAMLVDFRREGMM